MNWPLWLAYAALGVFAVSLWVDYCNARASAAPLKPVSWRYHLRHRWWLTPETKNDLWLFFAALSAVISLELVP